MAEQETLYNGDPAWRPEAHGIWKRFFDGEDGYTLNQAAINRARSGLEVVGSCRLCGGDLMVQPTQDPMTSGSHCAWTDFACQQCGHEWAAPDLKRLQRSSMHSGMPSGWWAGRLRAIQARILTRSL